MFAATTAPAELAALEPSPLPGLIFLVMVKSNPGFSSHSCINASKYTLRDVRYLGITVVILGLLSAAVYGYALEFWALGFGLCHIIYGSIMHFKYDRK